VRDVFACAHNAVGAWVHSDTCRAVRKTWDLKDAVARADAALFPEGPLAQLFEAAQGLAACCGNPTLTGPQFFAAYTALGEAVKAVQPLIDAHFADEAHSRAAAFL
jgi:hypothetical protein